MPDYPGTIFCKMHNVFNSRHARTCIIFFVSTIIKDTLAKDFRGKKVSKYLLEIGVEELPYKFIPSAMKQLEELFEKLLKDNNIKYGKINTYSTPRRLSVIIDELQPTQPDVKKVVKGPPSKIAFDENGVLSQAGKGFCSKQGICEKDIYKDKAGDIEYLFANIEQKGEKTSKILQDNVAALILKLQGSHFMRWSDFNSKFSRPIRWIVSILDDEEIKIKIENVESSRKTRTHRFAEKKEIEITSIDKYFDDLYAQNVIADDKKRKEKIVELLEKTASSINAEIKPDDELLLEVSNIVEWPNPVLCDFDSKYLAIPDIVTTTVMKSHQRYFPLYSKDGKLLNSYITVANYISDDFDNIKAGNQRVLKARLDDGIFFYNEDIKIPLKDRIEDLKGITFQKNLGTMFEKTARIVELSSKIADSLKLDSQQKEDIRRASTLCKVDLLTNLVREFTELQGFIGSDYAKQTENEIVSEAIKEHYFPISAEAEVAKTIEGQIVSIADKLDTVAAIFAVGKKPTGSADPLGIRRAVIGVISTIIKNSTSIDLTKFIKESVELLPIEISDKEAVCADIEDFFIQRLRIMFTQKYAYDAVDATIANKNPLKNLPDFEKRLETVALMSKQESFSKFLEAANRIIRITKNEKASSVDEKLFAHDVEKDLYEKAQQIDETKSTLAELAKSLDDLVPYIEKYFDKVLVMDENLEIRQNRLSMLSSVRDKFLYLADFSKIVL